jgi:P pilus assembly chaperone PapD
MHMNKFFNQIATISGLAIASTAFTVPAYAQAISVAVSPMVTINQLKGAQARASFSITNKGQQPLRTRVYAQDFDYDKQKGYVKTNTHANSANPYLQFSPKELIIPPGVTRVVRVNFTIPPSRPDGEYRVAVFTEDLTERKIFNPKDQYVAVLRPRIGSVFFISKGTASPQLSAISADWNAATNKPRLLLKNQGLASAYANIDWKLQQANTKITGESVRGIILQAERERLTDLEIAPGTKLIPGSYDLVGEIDNRDGKVIPFSLKVIIPAK